MGKFRIIQQKDTLPVENIGSLDKQNEENKLLGPRHSTLLPNNIRAIVCGPSGCGKTSLLFSLLTHPNGVRFKNVYVLSKSLEQEKYKNLKELFSFIPEIKYLPCSNEDEFPDPKDCEGNSIVVVDDVLCLKNDKDKVRAFFCFGRHRDLDIFYLYQTYTHIEKHPLRENCNFIILFSQDDLNLKHIFDDHLSGICPFDTFKEICRHVWQKGNHAFICISKENDINNGKLREGFDKFIFVDTITK
ncbi:hypothetical protein V9T40_001628 [Parthenolecanium corni]|uniref:Uncharacterized protein n=1 Tax=Parthenolecanium corni TaxID=536013 RepID=A0AAN9TID7_9HEMI